MTRTPPRSSEFFRGIESLNAKEWARAAIRWAFKLELELARRDEEIAALYRERDAFRTFAKSAMQAAHKYRFWSHTGLRVRDEYGIYSEEMSEFAKLQNEYLAAGVAIQPKELQS